MESRVITRQRMYSTHACGARSLGLVVGNNIRFESFCMFFVQIIVANGFERTKLSQLLCTKFPKVYWLAAQLIAKQSKVCQISNPNK